MASALPQWLTRLFGRPSLRDRIRIMREQAERSSHQYRAYQFARAGDLARDGGFQEEALRLYGNAIDGYLEAGRGRAAELICLRLLEAYPHVVRARCTLALIAVGHGDVQAARARIEDYVTAVVREQTADMAVPALLQMASATADDLVRAAIASALTRLGHADLGERVVKGKAGAADTTSWSRSVAGAIRHPREIDVETLTS